MRPILDALNVSAQLIAAQHQKDDYLLRFGRKFVEKPLHI